MCVSELPVMEIWRFPKLNYNATEWIKDVLCMNHQEYMTRHRKNRRAKPVPRINAWIDRNVYGMTVNEEMTELLIWGMKTLKE